MTVRVGEFVSLCMKQRGDSYVYGSEASFSDPDPDTFDCSELVEWACHRLGLTGMPDGSFNQYDYCKAAGLSIPVSKGIQTYGALLFRGTPNAPARDHVAISRGDGTTIEARGRAYGVNVFDATGRTWHAAARIPGLDYREHEGGLDLDAADKTYMEAEFDEVKKQTVALGKQAVHLQQQVIERQDVTNQLLREIKKLLEER